VGGGVETNYFHIVARPFRVVIPSPQRLPPVATLVRWRKWRPHPPVLPSRMDVPPSGGAHILCKASHVNPPSSRVTACVPGKCTREYFNMEMLKKSLIAATSRKRRRTLRRGSEFVGSLSIRSLVGQARTGISTVVARLIYRSKSSFAWVAVALV